LRVAEARSDRKRAEQDLEGAEAAAGSHRRVGRMWQRISERFAERAAHQRARIVKPARSGWQRGRNRIHGWLASLFTGLAERLAASAEDRLALADAAEERAAAALVALAEGETRLAEAEAVAAAARQRARDLRQAARETRARVKDQRRRAAEYRRLADKGDARRIQVRFVHDEAGRLLGRYARSGKATREYIHLGGIPVATVSRDGVHYVHADHLGTPRLVSEPDGPVIWSWISAPFGDGAADEDADGNGIPFSFNLRFPGQYFDAETGRHQATVPHYDPRLGRHVAPVSTTHTSNPYLYAGNNPLRFTAAGTAPGWSPVDCAPVTAAVAIPGACP
ncbi:MAG: RHS repeat-associated core domain-containing protein, partial [Halofilum sp. (in: g-proteobacteria)]|nr:RHS repeat-associated core domain-containing protein [Halofilum sp. (in: g-proteobacteria)]